MGVLETLLTAGGSAVTKAVAAGMVKKSASTFSQKFLAPFLEKRKAKKGLVDSAKKYIGRIDKATRSVNTFVFSSGVSLDDIYIPLSVSSDSGENVYKLDHFPAEMFDATRCVLLTDAAGMGKSTALKFIVQSSLLEMKVMPVWIELRRIGNDESLMGHICKTIAPDVSGCQAEMAEVFESGDVVFLLDGYDEIDDANRGRLNGEIANFSIQYDKCSFIVASRPDSELKGLSHFCEFTVSPLSMQEAFSLIRKYDRKGGVAERLISKVKVNGQIHEFLKNPLLVSLLFKAFDYKATIPLRRHIFFRQVFDALYQDHDLSKGGGFERKKKTSLDIEDFHKVVRALGIVTFFYGKVQYEMEQFQALLESAQKVASSVRFDASKLRMDLLGAVPIFVKDGPDVRWSHKAFQDYFAAQYIYYDSGPARDEMVRGLVDEGNLRRNENIALILADVDRDLVCRLIVVPWIERLLQDFYSSQERAQGGRFEKYQRDQIGVIYVATAEFREELVGEDDGFHKFLGSVGALNNEGNPLRSAFAPTGNDGWTYIVLEHEFLSAIYFINLLLGRGGRSGGRGTPGRTDISIPGLDLGGNGYRSLNDLVNDGVVDEGGVLSIYENFHGVAFFSERDALDLIEQSKVAEQQRGVEWLMGIAKRVPS